MKNFITSPGQLFFLLMLILAESTFIAGCSEPVEIQARGNADAAKSALANVLDSWKTGHPPEDLQSSDPAVWVADEDWEDKRKLSDYQIDSEPELNGGHWRVYVDLTLDGNRRPLEACYAVTLGDSISIIRSDFLH
jgi:hypothetical protein